MCHKLYMGIFSNTELRLSSISLNGYQTDDRYSPEKHLVDRILSGNEAAFTEFMRRYKGLVAHIVYRMVDNDADREDLHQEIWLKIFKNLQHFQFRSLLSTWVGRIAYNAAINYLRKSKTPLYNDIINSEEERDTISDNINTVSPEQSVTNAELRHTVESAIRRLSPRFRMIITLYHLDEMNYRQIGEITGLPEGTVKSHLFRARKTLKTLLSNSCNKEDFLK